MGKPKQVSLTRLVEEPLLLAGEMDGNPAVDRDTPQRAGGSYIYAERK